MVRVGRTITRRKDPMSDVTAARRARKGFFAAKAIAARTNPANDAAGTARRPRGPVPVHPFTVQIGLLPDSRTVVRPDGTIEYHDALIVAAASGQEIDGARIVARGAIAAHLAADPQMHGAPIEGLMVATDDGYELVEYHGSVMTSLADMAA
jgi:hypothetical protein